MTLFLSPPFLLGKALSPHTISNPPKVKTFLFKRRKKNNHFLSMCLILRRKIETNIYVGVVGRRTSSDTGRGYSFLLHKTRKCIKHTASVFFSFDHKNHLAPPKLSSCVVGDNVEAILHTPYKVQAHPPLHTFNPSTRLPKIFPDGFWRELCRACGSIVCMDSNTNTKMRRKMQTSNFLLHHHHHHHRHIESVIPTPCHHPSSLPTNYQLYTNYTLMI